MEEELQTRGRYKFIPFTEYNAKVLVENEEGVMVDEWVSPYRKSHPKARINLELTEVVLSCTNHHGSECSCLTHAAALEYIDTNWQKPEEVI